MNYSDLYLKVLPTQYGIGFVATIRPDLAPDYEGFKKHYGHLAGAAEDFKPGNPWEDSVRDWLIENLTLVNVEKIDNRPVWYQSNFDGTYKTFHSVNDAIASAKKHTGAVDIMQGNDFVVQVKAE